MLMLYLAVSRRVLLSSPTTRLHTHPLQARRFAATLGELTGGRVGLTCGSVGVLKGAVTIAIRYSAGRQQFGPPDGPEVGWAGVRGQVGSVWRPEDCPSGVS